MKVMQIQDDWGPEHIKLAKRPDPEPGSGEIVIDMKATAINPRDLILTQRGYGRHSGELPLIPLADGAGYVSAAGEGATKFQIGDMVTHAPLALRRGRRGGGGSGGGGRDRENSDGR